MTPPDLTQRQRLDLEEGKRLLNEERAMQERIRALPLDASVVVFHGPSDVTELHKWLRNNADALIAAAEREQEREEWKQRVLMPALTEWSEKLDAIAASLTPPEPQETP